MQWILNIITFSTFNVYGELMAHIKMCLWCILDIKYFKDCRSGLKVSFHRCMLLDSFLWTSMHRSFFSSSIILIHILVEFLGYFSFNQERNMFYIELRTWKRIFYLLFKCVAICKSLPSIQIDFVINVYSSKIKSFKVKVPS